MFVIVYLQTIFFLYVICVVYPRVRDFEPNYHLTYSET